VSQTPIHQASFEQIPAFRGLNAGEYHQLIEIAHQKTFSPGQKVIEQGKTSQFLWIVLDGRCQVVRENPGDAPVVLAELEPYHLFGEMSFFSPAPHSASVVAQSSLRLLCIDRSDYDDLLRDRVVAAYKLGYNILEGVAGKLRRMDERLAELAAQGDATSGVARQPEWRRFREKLFNGWSV
jgi:CRP-like cAMP-binding protein